MNDTRSSEYIERQLNVERLQGLLKKAFPEGFKTTGQIDESLIITKAKSNQAMLTHTWQQIQDKTSERDRLDQEIRELRQKVKHKELLRLMNAASQLVRQRSSDWEMFERFASEAINRLERIDSEVFSRQQSSDEHDNEAKEEEDDEILFNLS
eukprot:TRINITY_DN79953_c0_g1_i2.p2 TRINITY_DN79953_c0_g1~~TRINITY_DN79953_c0_g1_i2.p2  ORF type:complete len:153 (+),score=44.01 TRINITY_DN79953_c0_g1_i2:54-512(+)